MEYHKVIDAPIDLPIMMGQMICEPVKPVEKPIPPLSGKVVRPPVKDNKPNKFDILREQLNTSKNKKSDT